MIKTNIIGILRGISPDEVLDHVKVFRQYGITDIEIPTNSPGWHESVRVVKRYYGDDQKIGVGTVITLEHVAECISAGADYIVTPNTDATIIAKAKERGLGTCIGVFTPSEMLMAIEAKADLLKIFPAGAVSNLYPVLVKGPVPEGTKFVAVGGIDAQNIDAYLLTYDAVGVGSFLYKAGQSLEDTERNVKAILSVLKSN